MSQGSALSSDPTALPSGTRIRDYEVVQRVAAGGQGALYKVRRDGRLYALKLLCPGPDVSPRERERMDARMIREASVLFMMRHPNVVNALEFGRWPDAETGYPYIVMELVEGEQLYAWQRETHPPLRELAIMFIRIARALDDLHQHGLLHRDLKSENIIVRADGQPELIDFGIARLQHAVKLTRADRVLGTPSHLSPEYCEYLRSKSAAEEYTWRPADDLHALGYMLFEMLAGESPFWRAKGSVIDAIAQMVPPRARELNPRVPESLDAITIRLLEKRWEDRFARGNEVADALANALRGADESWDVPFATKAASH